MDREILKKFQEFAKEKGFKLSQEDIKELFYTFEETIISVAEELEVGERATVGCVVVERQMTKERVVKSNFGQEEEEHIIPAREIVKIKGKKSTLAKMTNK